MDLKDSVVNGGVLIIHKIQEGKHQYEVENVMKCKKASGKAFVRRGDKLMQINGMDLQDLTPEELAQSLAQNNLKLTVHKASSKEHSEPSHPAEDTLHPFNKEDASFHFHMKMRRLEDLEDNKVRQEGDIQEDGGVEEEVFQDANEVDGGRRVLLISMKKTSFSVLRGRGCDSGSCCQGCEGPGCTLNDVVMMAESSKVVLVSRGGAATFRQLKSLNTPIKHMASHHYLRGLCSHQSLYASENSENMTIYYYKSSSPDWRVFRGQPVVLNFAESNCFLRCCKDGEQVFLQVETCDKERLKKISLNDEVNLSFLFYMKSDATQTRTFESALHSGWFIQVDRAHSVGIRPKAGGMSEDSFLFIIET